MMQMNEIQKRLLQEVADLHEVPEGAYNIRSNSQSAGRRSTANIEIVSKQEVSGFLLAEMRLQQAMADIFKIVTEAADVDLPIPGIEG